MLDGFSMQCDVLGFIAEDIRGMQICSYLQSGTSSLGYESNARGFGMFVISLEYL